MIFIIIGVIAGLYICVYMFWDLAETIIGKILSIFFGIPLGILLGGFVGFIIASMIGGILYIVEIPQESKLISEVQIYSVVDNKGLNGQFALGYGKVSDELKYYYIVKEELGERVDSIQADHTHIQNTNDTPKLKTYERDFKNKVWLILGINFRQNNYYVLEVPNNTVKYNYNIDLK